MDSYPRNKSEGIPAKAKGAEGALWGSEELYRTMFETVSASMMLIDKGGRIVDVSTYHISSIEKGKIAREDLVGEDIVTNPTVVDAGLSAMYKRVLEGEPFEQKDVYFPSLIRGTDGYFNVRGVPLFNGDDVIGAIITHEEITERKRVGDTLRESEAKLRVMFESISDGITLTDLEGNIVDQNRAALNMFGFEGKEEIVGQDGLELVAKKDRTRARENNRRIFKEGSGGTIEYTLLTKDGREFEAEYSGALVRDSEGKPVGFIGVARDITQRKLADKALRESEEKLRRFMDSSTDFYTIWDSELNLIDLNEASLQYPLLRLTDGAKKEDFIGKNMLELEPGVKQRGRYDQYLDVIRTGKPFIAEDVIPHSTFGDIYLEVRAFKVGDGLGIVTEDITQRKHSEEALRQSERLRALGEMAGGMAHDFNNILAIILGRAQLALQDVEDDKLRKGIQVIEQTAIDAAITVRRLRDFGGAKGGRAFEVVDLNRLVEGALQMVEPRRMEMVETGGVNIEIGADLNEVPPVSGNGAELREALVNIIFNAMDAMPEGGKITVKSEQEDSLVVLSVSDTGMGMPEGVKERIFDPFFTTRAPHGTGLGLSVTYGIITRHGGSIDVESAQGEGTTFYIRLPVAEGVGGKRRPEGKPAVIDGANILIVDDDPEVSDVLGLMLQQLGCTVRVASSGKEALRAFKRRDYGLVIADLGMPDMSGRDVARAVKGLRPETPVILITGWGVQVGLKELPEIDGVIEKPFSKDTLSSQIADLLHTGNRAGIG
jgi:PAS domain S-box-containing protein